MIQPAPSLPADTQGTPLAILIGPPGAGKTAVARRVADILGAAHRDSDELVEQRAQRSVADIFVSGGEARFRAWESEACAELLHVSGAVISLGGGAVMTPATADEIRVASARGSSVVFLDVTIARAAPRLGLSGPRPLLAVNPRATWTMQAATRRPTYESLADHRIDTDGLTVDEVAEAVCRTLGH